MTEAPSPMSEGELTTYVAEHENEYVRQYVEALFDEQTELTSRLDDTLDDREPKNGRDGCAEWFARCGSRGAVLC